MNLFVGDKPNVEAFDADVRRASHDLSDLLLVAAQTQSALVESTHFLMVIAQVANGATQKGLAQLGLTIEQWQTGLADCVRKTTGGLPPPHLTRDTLHASAHAALNAAQDLCARFDLPRISEPVLLHACLRHATPAVRELCASADIDLEGWCAKLEQQIRPVKSLAAFNGDGTVRLDSFSPSAKRVLRLLKRETESLGYKLADPRHLLLALLEHENGVMQYGVYHQGLRPRKLEEIVMLNLRSKAKRERSQIALAQDSFQPLLRHIMLQAGELAARDHAEAINEAHLLRAFLLTETSARTLLEDEKIKLAELNAIAENYDASEETEVDSDVADIQTVRARLQARLVGQDEAIERILPYIQRMRFGFTTPNRPVGVFLFCGQSGSGKTEMAKELARAVYGSEENLIFLEMGQFNAPESMNIFVGAPPGYIGYGEGKLTNGLRDKPRAVVLFDEIEKANTEVLDALLRFLDEGRIDDPAGPVRDGTQCIVILTSNVGADELSQLWSQIKNDANWRTTVRKTLRAEFKKHNFRTEFLNRVDELILFRTLTLLDYAEIAARLLKRDLERLQRERQIEVVADESVCQEIGSYCAAVGEGARAAQRLTQSTVITPVIDFVLRHSCVPPVRLRVKATRPTDEADCEPLGTVEFAEGKAQR
jgi:ATP-dependent Clp protease ATP-binding subunit ClpC